VGACGRGCEGGKDKERER
jgi:hypothetical protein